MKGTRNDIMYASDHWCDDLGSTVGSSLIIDRCGRWRAVPETEFKEAMGRR